MTQQDALDLVRRLLKAADDEELMRLVTANLGAVDGVFFSTAEAAAQQLEREGKAPIAGALRGLVDRMLRMKTLI
jgi:hypothetical protein